LPWNPAFFDLFGGCHLPGGGSHLQFLRHIRFAERFVLYLQVKKGKAMKTRRRQFLAAGMTFGAAGFAAAMPRVLAAEPKEAAEEDVSPAEDLMREHGILRRILLIYAEAVRRLEAHEELPPKPVVDSAKIVRSFIEDYHEKLEEDFIFPRFKKAGKLVDLTGVLLEQHQAGRRLTDATLRLATVEGFKSPDDRSKFVAAIRQFARMYHPHAAREDTVLLPAFHEIVNAREYDALGEDFERREHELFGKDGFEGVVARVAEIEKGLGIYELSQFTPK
jgi:hemerythrin-like domain-containing protein